MSEHGHWPAIPRVQWPALFEDLRRRADTDGWSTEVRRHHVERVYRRVDDLSIDLLAPHIGRPGSPPNREGILNAATQMQDLRELARRTYKALLPDDTSQDPPWEDWRR